MSKEVIYKTGDYHRNEDDTRHYSNMYTVHIVFQKCVNTVRSVDKHKRKEEDRKDDHLDQLWDKMTESSGKSAHFLVTNLV